MHSGDGRLLRRSESGSESPASQPPLCSGRVWVRCGRRALGGSTRSSLQVVRTQEEAYQLPGLQAPRFEPLEEAEAGEPAG